MSEEPTVTALPGCGCGERTASARGYRSGLGIVEVLKRERRGKRRAAGLCGWVVPKRSHAPIR